MPKIPKNKQLVLETAWEVCNQVGGIYTVIRTKTHAMVTKYGEDYILIGPYVGDQIQAELDFETRRTGTVSNVIKSLKVKNDWKIYDANWLVMGRPRVILFDIASVMDNIFALKYNLAKEYSIEFQQDDLLVDKAVAFGYMVSEFLSQLLKVKDCPNLIAHFHEWQAAVPFLYLRKSRPKLKTVFTTHATMLGRYLAVNSPFFYNHLPFFDSDKEAKYFGIHAQVRIEEMAAKNCDTFTTVSEVTARECKHLLKRTPDVILPNGLNIKRFVVLHEFQNLHARFKEEIHQFIMGYFFQAYSFDLENTLYFFSSGRYEYKNKGFDITLEALKLLNDKMVAEKSKMTVVMFFVTRKPNRGMISQILESKGIMEEIRQNCDQIKEQVGKRLFLSSTADDDHRLPNLNEFVDDYWRIRYRRTIQSWKTKMKPSLVTHNLENPQQDEILRKLYELGLDNGPEKKVKVVYHPEFITTTNPLFGIEYHEFVRGCHLGIFPSYYEPWGYTPLECMASGIPSITSDLSGFGDYVLRNIDDHVKKGIWVLERGKRETEWSIQDLTKALYEFTLLSRRDRIMQRNNTENASIMFDWNNLIGNYEKAYKAALRKVIKVKTPAKPKQKTRRKKKTPVDVKQKTSEIRT